MNDLKKFKCIENRGGLVAVFENTFRTLERKGLDPATTALTEKNLEDRIDNLKQNGRDVSVEQKGLDALRQALDSPQNQP